MAFGGTCSGICPRSVSWRIRLAAVIFITFPGFAQAEAKFETAAIHLEQNLRDRDAEVKIEAVGADEGFTALKITAPDGRTVIDFKAPDSSVGIRNLTFESPEPKDIQRIKSDFPPGTYKFSGSFASGARADGEAVLGHEFPEAASVIHPPPDQSGIPVGGLIVRWRPVKNVSAFVVTIEQDHSTREIRANLDGGTTSFAVPSGFLVPGKEYTLAIGALSKGGNISFVETAFTTATKK